MPKLGTRIVDRVQPGSTDYFLWDDELPGFGLRVHPSGRLSHVIQHRSKGRTQRHTIGTHGVLTPETARRDARAPLGRVAQGENPLAEKLSDLRAITMKDPCLQYLEDATVGLILGKKQRPKKQSTIYVDEGRIRRHIIPLLGARRGRDIESADVIRFMRDNQSGRTRLDQKTGMRGRSIVRGGRGTANRIAGLLGAIFAYARRPRSPAGPVFPGTEDGKPLIGFPKRWLRIVAGTPLASITPHVLRHGPSCVSQRVGTRSAIGLARRSGGVGLPPLWSHRGPVRGAKTDPAMATR